MGKDGPGREITVEPLRIPAPIELPKAPAAPPAPAAPVKAPSGP
ncbi:MAG: hypothetical protein QOG35_1980 [Solirubrobacteraceae bacterium]|jgi:hypothetical protein|nr:hypothetical protein [Solirubrobacteraceae bacterium]